MICVHERKPPSFADKSRWGERMWYTFLAMIQKGVLGVRVYACIAVS